MKYLIILLSLSLLGCKKNDPSTPLTTNDPTPKKITTIQGSLQIKNENGLVINPDTSEKFVIKLSGPTNSTLITRAGTFEFKDLKQGSYKIEINKSGYGYFLSSTIQTNDQPIQNAGVQTLYQKPSFELNSFDIDDSTSIGGYLILKLTSAFNSNQHDRGSIVLFGKTRNINLQDTSTFIFSDGVTAYNNSFSGQRYVYYILNSNAILSGQYLYAISVSCSGRYWKNDKPTNIVSGNIILKDSVQIP
jgi:hypothetical protein